MTDERDPRVSRRYRQLGNEEPSRELDQSILAAARRAAEKPHAPLVAPDGRHRWHFAFGAAAVIVLAVAVTYEMQSEQPDPYANGVSGEAAKATPEADKRSKTAQPEVQQAPRALSRKASPAAPPAEDRAARGAASESMTQDTPQAMLERALELRKEGKLEEAERLLAELKRRYPDYRIPENLVRP